MSLRKGSFGYALKEELEEARQSGSGEWTRGERVPGRGNKTSKDLLDGRELSAFKELNKGQCG